MQGGEGLRALARSEWPNGRRASASHHFYAVTFRLAHSITHQLRLDLHVGATRYSARGPSRAPQPLEDNCASIRRESKSPGEVAL